MSSPAQEPPSYGFVMGLLTGTCLGLSLTLWFVPRAVDGPTRTRHDVRDDVAQAVASLENEGNPPVEESER